MKQIKNAIVLIIFTAMATGFLYSCNGRGSGEVTTSVPDTTPEVTTAPATAAPETTEDSSSYAANDIRRWRDKVRAGDWGMALSAALGESDSVYIPAGTYRMSAVSVPSGKTVYGDGA